MFAFFAHRWYTEAMKGCDSMYRPEEDEICGYLCVHEDKVRAVQERIPEAAVLNSMAELFKMFGDGTRLRILCVLLEEEVCVCDLARLLGMTISAVSHQLRLLRQARLIKSRRDGRTIFYSLDDDHVATLLRQGLEHVGEH